MRIRLLPLAVALTSAVLYSSLLPLWNGFDEPFHYGYVETLVRQHRFPRLRETPVTDEIRESLDIAPMPRFVQEMAPRAISIEQWAQLPSTQKLARRAELNGLSPNLRGQSSGLSNYEAQQTPLAYLLLTPIDAVLSSIHLPVRILLLRLFSSIAAALLLYVAARRLAGALEVHGAFATAAIFCIFLTQMLWAAIAHVGNDALSIPLVVLFLALLPVVTKPGKDTRRDFVFLCGVLAAGLLAKAYFLTLVPVFVAVLMLKNVRRSLTLRSLMLCASMLAIAAAWYARNLALYGSISGTQESASGVTFGKAIAALPKIHWLSSALNFAHWSLWTGDWSFVSFSKATLNLELLLIAGGIVMYAASCRARLKTDAWILAACLCFLLGLIYQTCVTWVSSQGASQFAEPWYGQGILVCVWLLAFRGFQGARMPGRVVASLLCGLSGWIALVTYLAKLPIFYTTGGSRSGIHSVIAFWAAQPGDALRPIVLGPVWLLYSSLLIFVIVAPLTMGIVIRGLFGRLCS